MELPTKLSERFIRSVRSMVLLLAFFGLDLRDSNIRNHHQPRCQRISKLAWCLFWLILHFQTSFYVFYMRTIRSLLVPALFHSSGIGDPTAEIIMHFIFRLSPVVFGGPFVHLFLTLTLRRTIQSILGDLEMVDLKLGRPKWPSISNWSTTATIWISVLFIMKSSFSVYWDLNHPVRVVPVLESASKLVTTLTQVYAVAAVWMFAICSQLFVGIYKEIALQIESEFSLGTEEKMRFLLDSHKQLTGAVNQIRNRFGWILMANTCFMALNLFYTLYYSIEFLHDRYWVTGFHHLLDLFTAFFRLWLGCHSADLIRKKPKTFWIPILRQMRDSHITSYQNISLSQRTKLTLLIIEVTRSAEKPLTLLGIVPLSKSLLLPLIQNSLAFVIIVYQFKDVGNRYDTGKKT